MTKEEIIKECQRTLKKYNDELERLNLRHEVVINIIAEYRHLLMDITDNNLDKVLKENDHAGLTE